MTDVSPKLRPTRASGTFAVLCGFVAIVWLGARPRGPLYVEAGGLLALTAGLVVLQRGWRLPGLVVVTTALAVVATAVALVWTSTTDPLAVVQVVPGMLGVVVLALGVVPARGRGSRRLVKAGTALLFVTLFGVAVVGRPSLDTLLGAAIATILAWDAGEFAIGTGAQLGRRARTWPVEASHLFGTAAVGGLAVGGARLVTGLGSTGPPLGAFVLLVIGLVVLAAAFHE